MDMIVFRLACFLVIILSVYVSNSVVPSSISYVYDLVARMLLGYFMVQMTFPIVKKTFFHRKVSTVNKAVIITGCDTGLGHNLAKRLDALGFSVFACCLFPSGNGANNLKQICSKSLHVIGLDVRKDEDVKEVLDYVKKNLNGSKLWAVINNAGIYDGFEAEWTKIETFQECMDVNTMGVVRVTKAFLPLLRETKGRVITVTSILAHIYMHSTAAYGMTKAATARFCDCLRQEMYPWGVKVITIEPDMFESKLMDYSSMELKLDQLVQILDKNIRTDYGEKYFETYKKLHKLSSTSPGKRCTTMDDLVDAVCLEEPDLVYRPRRNNVARIIVFIWEILPKTIKDSAIFYALHYGAGLRLPQTHI